jgi:hypothetical protein
MKPRASCMLSTELYPSPSPCILLVYSSTSSSSGPIGRGYYHTMTVRANQMWIRWKFALESSKMKAYTNNFWALFFIETWTWICSLIEHSPNSESVQKYLLITDMVPAQMSPSVHVVNLSLHCETIKGWGFHRIMSVRASGMELVPFRALIQRLQRTSWPFALCLLPCEDSAPRHHNKWCQELTLIVSNGNTGLRAQMSKPSA